MYLSNQSCKNWFNIIFFKRLPWFIWPSEKFIKKIYCLQHNNKPNKYGFELSKFDKILFYWKLLQNHVLEVQLIQIEVNYVFSNYLRVFSITLLRPRTKLERTCFEKNEKKTGGIVIYFRGRPICYNRCNHNIYPLTSKNIGLNIFDNSILTNFYVTT